ncbi:MAG: hypothetical protein E7568_02000 [Ruminococcaceae bacterium]|nr:hypothetical protein [Oscillospiraceae bacterium]
MDITALIFIIALNIAAFLVGILLGRLYRLNKNHSFGRKKCSNTKNADWLLLMNYYPDEPTEILSSNKNKRR